ncbi:MAG: glycosyltransferase [Cyanobacteria bacterium P01_H01_bin.58]
MIVWIASYPRSGNTFFRILLHHFSGFPTYHLYAENDAEMSLDRGKLAGHKNLPYSLQEMRDSSEIFFVKTHDLPCDQSPAIYLIRDGRDASLSYLKYIRSYEKDYADDKTDTQILHTLIAGKDSFGGWSNNVLAWIQRTAPTVVVRFEYLINHPNPKSVVEYVFQKLELNSFLPDKNENPPSFEELQQAEPTFFSSGQVGKWQTDMPKETQQLFWECHGYAMHKVGYLQKQIFPEPDLQLLGTSLLQHDNKVVRERTIQNPSFIQKLYPIYWPVLSARSLLKKAVLGILPQKVITYIRHRRSHPLSLKPQFDPRPLQLPEHYYQSSLDSSQLQHLPVVSIVTPSYNQAQFIEQTIKSVLAQDYPKLEYIVQDGASDDGTSEILKRYESQIKYIESSPDSGQSQAINRGFQKSTGEIMAWLNSDDLLIPGTVSYVAQYFANNPEVDVVYGHRILINEQGQEFGRWILPPHEDKILSWADYIPQETLFWRRSLWEKAGGWINESYRFAMDWDLLVRFLGARANFVCLPRFLGAFRVHDSQKTQGIVDIGEEEMHRIRYFLHRQAVSPLLIKAQIKEHLKKALEYQRKVEIK